MKTHNYKGKEISKNDWGIFDEENNIYKYPLDTEEHVKSAIKFYNYYSDTKYADDLANNIINHMKKYNISTDIIGKDNKLSSYINKSLLKEEFSPKAVDTYYRYTYDGTGIYQAAKEIMGPIEWKKFLKSKAAAWLNKYETYYDNNHPNTKSYFTRKGKTIFDTKTLPYLYNFLDKNRVFLESKQIPNYQILAYDEMQVYVDDTIEFDKGGKLINGRKWMPIYLVTSFTYTSLGKIISKIQNTTVSHIAISFDSSLEHMYAFHGDIKDVTGGLRIETINDYINSSSKSYIRVICLYLKPNQFEELQNIVWDMMTNIHKYKYHYGGLLQVLFNIRKASWNLDMICSEFIIATLGLIGINLDTNNKKASNLVTPDEISNIDKHKNAYIVYDGLCVNYDKNKVDKITEKIAQNAKFIKEEYSVDSLQYNLFSNSVELIDMNQNEDIQNEFAVIIEGGKEFPIDFEEDGSIIIKNYKKLNFEIEYSKSHKLLKIYEDSNNIEGMKYELSKLWFMNLVLEKRIYANPTEEELKAYTKVRARILNDFNKYLKIILKSEPDFNFSYYYNNSPFSDVQIKIPGSLINGIAGLVKQLL